MLQNKAIDMFYTKIYKPGLNKNKNLERYIFPVYFHKTSKTPSKMMKNHQLLMILAVLPVINYKIIKMTLITQILMILKPLELGLEMLVMQTLNL